MCKAHQWSTMGKIFLGNLSMQAILVRTSYTPVHLSGWSWGGRRASGDGSVPAIFLGGKSHGSIAFGHPPFSGGKSY